MLPRGQWRIVHAADWPDGEQQALVARLARDPGVSPGLVADLRHRCRAAHRRRRESSSTQRSAGLVGDRDEIGAKAAAAACEAVRHESRVDPLDQRSGAARDRASGPFRLREAVEVGPQALLGEVVRLHDDEIVVQVYEDTTGLRPGAEVVGHGLPLAIRLGPGLLGNIFDGLLRPLSGADSAFVAPGMRRAAPGRLSRSSRASRRGDTLAAGAVYGVGRPRLPGARNAASARPMSAAK